MVPDRHDNTYRELVRLLTQAGEWAEEGRALPFDLALMLRAKADGLMTELGEAADDLLRSDLLRRGREYLVEHCSLRRLCPEAYRAFEECREAEGVFTDRAGHVYFWRVGKAHEETGREHWVLEVRTAGGECLGPLGPTTGRAYWGVKVVAKGRG